MLVRGRWWIASGLLKLSEAMTRGTPADALACRSGWWRRDLERLRREYRTESEDIPRPGWTEYEERYAESLGRGPK